MTTELHLVRHGETDWNAAGRVQGQAESRLTERGWQQARALGQQLDPTAYDAVYCSSALRTRQTLDGLLSGRRCAVVFQDCLREIFLGPWQGLMRSEVDVTWTEASDDFRHRPGHFALDGAETFMQLQLRGLAAVDAIAAAHRDQRVLVVSHGALIKSIYCGVTDTPLDQLWQPPATDNCARFVIAVNGDGSRDFVAHHVGGDALF